MALVGERGDRLFDSLEDALQQSDVETLLKLREEITSDESLTEGERDWLAGTATEYAGGLALSQMTDDEVRRQRESGEMTPLQERIYGAPQVEAEDSGD